MHGKNACKIKAHQCFKRLTHRLFQTRTGFHAYARGLVTCWFRFVCTRLIPTDNRLMDAGSTGSYFTARYESTNTDKSEARGLNTRNEEQVRIIMQCTDIFGQKWRFPLFLDSIHAIIIRKKLRLTVSC